MENVKPLLVIQHAAWEGPHRVLDAFGDIPVTTLMPLDGTVALPHPSAVRGAVIMGGPMSVNDGPRYPGLDAEVEWVRGALAAGLPMLGI